MGKKILRSVQGGNEMRGSECRLIEYMEGAKKRFIIPVYQRNYDWKTENCKQLFDDFIKVTEKEKEIIELFRIDPGYTYTDLAPNLKVSRKTVSDRIKSLKDKGIIERIGSDTKGYVYVHLYSNPLCVQNLIIGNIC